MTGCICASAPPRTTSLDLIQRGGGRRAEIYTRLKDLAERYGDEIRKRYPNIPRRVSGYNLDDLLPEKGFHVARVAGRVGEHLRAGSRPPRCGLLHFPPKRALLLLGYPDVGQRGG